MKSEAKQQHYQTYWNLGQHDDTGALLPLLNVKQVSALVQQSTAVPVPHAFSVALHFTGAGTCAVEVLAV
jgi:hypothetical protein